MTTMMMNNGSRMKKILFALALATGTAFAQQQEPNIPLEMLVAFIKLDVASEVVSQAEKMAAPLKEKSRRKVLAPALEYHDGVVDSIRERLVAVIGDAEGAQEAFGEFVGTYTELASANDMDFLSSISAMIGLEPAPSSYGELRGSVIEKFMPADMEAAGRILSAIQAKVENMLKKIAEKKRKNSLKDSEADAGEFVESRDDGANSLRSFAANAKARREKAIAEAQAGMAQVAQERSVADAEYNAKKQAAAQAEAAGMRSLAEANAAAEAEAAQQRANSWSSRIKDVVSAGIGAGTGAFAGTVGSRAGQSAARAVFK